MIKKTGDLLKNIARDFNNFLKKTKCDYCGSKFSNGDMFYEIRPKRVIKPKYIHFNTETITKICCNVCYKKLYR